MQFICEIVPSSLLTPLRRTIAHKLTKSGLKQVEIAHMLGVSQPVISTYLKSAGVMDSPLESRPTFQEMASELYNHLLSGQTSKIDMMNMICSYCQDSRIAGPLCDIHRKKAVIDFPPDCNLCFPSPEQAVMFDRKLDATKELYEAAQLLVQMEERFGYLIPEIGCQFVYIAEGDHSMANIVGFPGRIVKVKGKGRIVSPPEFGQGSTLATILSFFCSHNSPYRALISLRRTGELLKKVTPHFTVASTTAADKDWDKTLKTLLTKDLTAIDIIEDSGGVGFEPILYLFGSTPFNIVDRIRNYF